MSRFASNAASPRSLPQPGHRYDVAVVGAGLAGGELAWRLAHNGRDVLLVTQALDNVGNLYHPRVPGSFPQGTLFEQARQRALPDDTGWALHRQVKFLLETTPGIHLLQSCVAGLEIDPSGPHVLHTWEGPALRAHIVALAVGSFLNARLSIGEVAEEAGRLSEVAYDFLWRDLSEQGVTFEEAEGSWQGEAGGLPYQVRFLTLAPDELEGFRLKRWPRVFALGRCAPGELDYAGTLRQAGELAGELVGELLPGELGA